ncbi:MAG: TolC family protein [Sulfuricella denitrificans]|nr:TolC family protein [Sulfuricella denitrificans]
MKLFPLRAYGGHISLVWGLLALVLARSAPADTLNFAQCVDAALRQNPGLSASRAQVQQAEAGLVQAQAGHLPKVTFSLNAVRTNDALSAFGLKLSQRGATFDDFGASQFVGPASLLVAPDHLNHPDAVSNVNTRLEAQLPLYTGGMIEGYVEQAQAYIKAAREGDQSARQQLIFQVLQAYEGVHAARAYVNVAQQGEVAAASYVKTIDSLLKQGVVVKSDLLSARIHLEDVRVKLVKAQNSEAAALDQLHLLLGLPLSQSLDVGPQVTFARLPGRIDELREQALNDNPGLNAMRNQLQAAQANVKVAKSGFYPQLGLMARQDWNDKNAGFNASSYTVGGMMSWNVFDGGTVRGAVDRAAAGKAELAARLQQAESGVTFQVADAWRRADEAEQRVAVRELAVTHAEEALGLVEKRYNNGVTTITELLAARAQLDNARADVVAAKYDLAIQRAGLRLALGKLEPEMK